ncbi:hypothetical protein NM69100_2214 [Neisseria meningitidis 69100]|nr:hypothetical protein NM96060_2240 [Neisseria meningitidis 96060]EOB51755.1 hypothetical protein NM69100_2214 [Neisseria meningitidis 69100]
MPPATVPTATPRIPLIRILPIFSNPLFLPKMQQTQVEPRPNLRLLPHLIPIVSYPYIFLPCQSNKDRRLYKN